MAFSNVHFLENKYLRKSFTADQKDLAPWVFASSFLSPIEIQKLSAFSKSHQAWVGNQPLWQRNCKCLNSLGTVSKTYRTLFYEAVEANHVLALLRIAECYLSRKGWVFSKEKTLQFLNRIPHSSLSKELKIRVFFYESSLNQTSLPLENVKKIYSDPEIALHEKILFSDLLARYDSENQINYIEELKEFIPPFSEDLKAWRQQKGIKKRTLSILRGHAIRLTFPDMESTLNQEKLQTFPFESYFNRLTCLEFKRDPYAAFLRCKIIYLSWNFDFRNYTSENDKLFQANYKFCMNHSGTPESKKEELFLMQFLTPILRAPSLCTHLFPFLAECPIPLSDKSMHIIKASFAWLRLNGYSKEITESKACKHLKQYALFRLSPDNQGFLLCHPLIQKILSRPVGSEDI